MSHLTEEAKVVLIADGTSEIGSETARLFAKQGYKLSIVGSEEELLAKIARECTDLSPQNFQVFTQVVDLSDWINGGVVVERTVDHYGKLDVLVNNAGINQKTRPTDKSSFDLYKNTINVNVDSIVKASMEAVPYLEKNNGSIVFVMTAGLARQLATNYAYLMSVAAISNYAKCLAMDVAPKIRVNILSVGNCSGGGSEIQSVKPASPNLFNENEKEKIVGTVYYLASDEAAFVNGAEFYLDRGNIQVVTETV